MLYDTMNIQLIVKDFPDGEAKAVVRIGRTDKGVFEYEMAHVWVKPKDKRKKEYVLGRATWDSDLRGKTNEEKAQAIKEYWEEKLGAEKLKKLFREAWLQLEPKG